jgi:hypothetical protein
MTRRLFPDTFAKIKRAKAEGILPQAVWSSMVIGINESGMRPSAQAMTLGTYYEYMIEIYGKRATAFLREKAGSA